MRRTGVTCPQCGTALLGGAVACQKCHYTCAAAFGRVLGKESRSERLRDLVGLLKKGWPLSDAAKACGVTYPTAKFALLRWIVLPEWGDMKREVDEALEACP